MEDHLAKSSGENKAASPRHNVVLQQYSSSDVCVGDDAAAAYAINGSALAEANRKLMMDRVLAFVTMKQAERDAFGVIEEASDRTVASGQSTQAASVLLHGTAVESVSIIDACEMNSTTLYSLPNRASIPCASSQEMRTTRTPQECQFNQVRALAEHPEMESLRLRPADVTAVVDASSPTVMQECPLTEYLEVPEVSPETYDQVGSMEASATIPPLGTLFVHMRNALAFAERCVEEVDTLVASDVLVADAWKVAGIADEALLRLESMLAMGEVSLSGQANANSTN